MIARIVSVTLLLISFASSASARPDSTPGLPRRLAGGAAMGLGGLLVFTGAIVFLSASGPCKDPETSEDDTGECSAESIRQEKELAAGMAIGGAGIFLGGKYLYDPNFKLGVVSNGSQTALAMTVLY